MAIMDGDMILIFIVSGMFSLLLVALMLVYIRCDQRGIDPADRDESLHDQIDQLMLARTILDKDHQSGCLGDSDYAASCLDIDRRLLGLGHQSAKGPVSEQTFIRLTAGLAIILPLATALIYANLGRPDLADNPLSKRTAEISSSARL